VFAYAVTQIDFINLVLIESGSVDLKWFMFGYTKKLVISVL
jgi:hypothetical protein